MFNIVAISSAVVCIVAVGEYGRGTLVTANAANIVTVAGCFASAEAACYFSVASVAGSATDAASIAIRRVCCKYSGLAVAVCNGCVVGNPTDNTAYIALSLEIGVGNTHVADGGTIGVAE